MWIVVHPTEYPYVERFEDESDARGYYKKLIEQIDDGNVYFAEVIDCNIMLFK